MATRTPSWSERIRRLKEVVPIEAVIGEYVTLIPEGHRYLRGKEHDSLVVDRWTGRYYWNARGESGDVVDFVRHQDGLDLPAALARLGERVLDSRDSRGYPDPGRPHRRRPRAPHPPSLMVGRRMLRALRVAVSTYHAALWENAPARAYLATRGIDDQTVRELQLGVCDGTRLIAALERAGVPRRDARRAGLLVGHRASGDGDGQGTPAGREFLAGRIVVPEIGPAGPVWLIGRNLPDGVGLRYLSLPLSKPLLGYHRARSSPVVLVTEGVFDLLTLVTWGLPGVALAGTDPGPRALGQLRRLALTSRLYIVPQSDAAGQHAAARLNALLPEPAPIIALPAGVKDLSELAEHPDLSAAFLDALPPPVRALLRPSTSVPME